MNKNTLFPAPEASPDPDGRDGATARFTTNAYPKEQRWDAWRFALQRKSIRLEALNGEAVYGEMSAYQSQQKIDFISVSSTAQTLRIDLSDQSDQIWLAAVLTIWSMVYYLRKAIPEIRAKAR